MRSVPLAAPWFLGGFAALALCWGQLARAQEVPGTFPETSSRLLTAAEVADIRLDSLAMMRNEVFARHGHRFKTTWLASHFERQPWYKPKVDDAGPLLTEIERKNVALIQKAEKQAKAAERAKEEAEERVAWAALPADVQGFWKKFRAALKSGDAARVSAFVADDFRDGLGPMMRDGHSQRIGRAGFAGNVWGYLPESVIQRMQKRGPYYDDGIVRFSTGEMADDEFSQAGRIYRFKGKNGHYRLAGVYVEAGPGDEG